MELHCLRAKEEPRAYVAIRQSLGDEERDLQLLRGETLGVRGSAPLDVLAAGAEFDSDMLCPRLRSDPVEGRER